MTAKKTAAKKTAARKDDHAPQPGRRTVAAPAPDVVPTIRVACGWPQCKQHGKEQEVPAGILLTPGILMTGSMSCTACGNHVLVLGGS